MLFDLRSRGRRRTVQAVYLGLAILMGGGLVLFGVGAGNGLGGLLNAFTGKGSNSNQSAVVSQAEKNAIKATQTNPASAAAWANLIQARWSQARSSRTGSTTRSWSSSPIPTSPSSPPAPTSTSATTLLPPARGPTSPPPIPP